MIRLREYDAAPMELPEKPLKEWRAKFEGNNLHAPELMQYFHVASPFFFNIEQVAEYAELGRSFLCIYQQTNKQQQQQKYWNEKNVIDKVYKNAYIGLWNRLVGGMD